ncbi:hypothetical protein STENM327S_00330 [Streptomyces tendae]
MGFTEVVAAPDKHGAIGHAELRWPGGGALVFGLLQPGLDSRLTAAGLLAMSAGLGTSILVGQRSAASATAVLDQRLDRIFRAGDTTG